MFTRILAEQSLRAMLHCECSKLQLTNHWPVAQTARSSPIVRLTPYITTRRKATCMATVLLVVSALEIWRSSKNSSLYSNRMTARQCRFSGLGLQEGVFRMRWLNALNHNGCVSQLY